MPTPFFNRQKSCTRIITFIPKRKGKMLAWKRGKTCFNSIHFQVRNEQAKKLSCLLWVCQKKKRKKRKQGIKKTRCYYSFPILLCPYATLHCFIENPHAFVFLCFFKLNSGLNPFFYGTAFFFLNARKETSKEKRGNNCHNLCAYTLLILIKNYKKKTYFVRYSIVYLLLLSVLFYSSFCYMKKKAFLYEFNKSKTIQIHF